MPELPEVESVRRTLEPLALGIRVRAVRVLRSDFVTPAAAQLTRLAGMRLTTTSRHGKKLFLTFCANAGKGPADSPTLHLHLGMSGRVDCVPGEAAVPKHTHVIFSLDNGMDVRLRDPRRFGGLWYYASLDEALAAQTAELGPDALTITAEHLSAAWKGAGGRLKARLLSQRDVAGLGNIYVDEALWMTRLHPLQAVARLRNEQICELVTHMQAVLRRSIVSGGTTLRDYRNVSDQPGEFARQLQAYGRAGEPCGRCGTAMRSAQVATRTTVFCPACQKRR